MGAINLYFDNTQTLANTTINLGYLGYSNLAVYDPSEVGIILTLVFFSTMAALVT